MTHRPSRPYRWLRALAQARDGGPLGRHGGVPRSVRVGDRGPGRPRQRPRHRPVLGRHHRAIRHDPDNWVGTWLTAAGTAIALINAHGTWQDALAAEPSALPASPLLFVLTQGVWMAWFVPYAMVVVLFPDGRPWGRLGRACATALLAIPVLFNLLTAVIPGPLMPPLQDWPRPLGTHPVGYLSLALLPLFLAALVGAGVSLWRRHAAATDPRAQAQIRWMLLAASLLPATLVLCWVGFLVVGGPAPVVVGLVAFNIAMPAATFVAIMRHDLYDVDRAIVLAGVYALLALGVVAGYAAISVLLGRALGAESVTAAVVATVAVMLALLPARSFLLRVLGRRLHQRRTAGGLPTAREQRIPRCPRAAGRGGGRSADPLRRARGWHRGAGATRCAGPG